MIFQEAHYNPVTGRMGCDRPLEQLMPWFYWLGIQAGYAPMVHLLGGLKPASKGSLVSVFHLYLANGQGILG